MIKEMKDVNVQKTNDCDDKNYLSLKKLIEEQMEIFELKELVGKGSESYVYKTLIKEKNRYVAMKIIYKNKKHSINETGIVNRLKSKNVVKCFGMKNIKDKNFEVDCLIMEYSKFGNLRQFQKNFIKKIYMTESLLCYFSYHILKGLKYCHMSKIAHLDIKPLNIIIDETLNLKIIDFSISIDYRNINKLKLPKKGTKYYMSPEVLNSDIINANDLEKVDLFSLGVMLYNLAFCSYPYQNEGEKEEELVSNKHKLLESNKFQFSNYFIDFINKLLEKDINKRININQASEHYWIKGAELLLEEKEKLNNANIFLSYLIYDYFPNFNEYLL